MGKSYLFSLYTKDLNLQNFTGLLSPSIAYKELDRLMSILTKQTYQSTPKHWRVGRRLPLLQAHVHLLWLLYTMCIQPALSFCDATFTESNILLASKKEDPSGSLDF